MADNAAESALRYLRDPAVAAGLGAVAVASMYYLASRPTPQPCPVDPQKQSFELPDGDYARMNSLTTELVEKLFEDVSTSHEAFLRGVRLSGDKPCLGYRSSPGGSYAWLTYNEVLERSVNTGSGLMEIGCDPAHDGHVFVGVYAPNKIEWVLVEQACNMYSMTIVPLYDTLGPESCAYIINQAQMVSVVCDESKMKVLLDQCDKCPKLKNIIKIGPAITDDEKAAGDKAGIKVISFKDLEDLGKNHRHEKKPPKPDDLAVVCYTSGTTGNPKGAMITHKNVIAMLSGLVYLVQKGLKCRLSDQNVSGDWIEFYPDSDVTLVAKCGITVSEDDVHISYLPLAHMYERLAQLMIFTYGGKVGFFGGNVRNILDDLQTLKPTIFISVPRVLNRVYDRVIKQVSSSSIKSFLFNMAMRSKKADLERNIVRNNSIWDYLVFRKIQNSLGGRVRFLISGSAPLRDDVMVFLRCALGCQVFEGYGQTETTAAATLQMIGDHTYGHVGPPLPCNKIKLVDVPEMEYYAKDGKGEVCFYGPNVFKGYLYDEEKTKEAIDDDGWLHSGDVGEWQPNGTLKVIDRKKHIFKLAQGEYIAPEKIETVYTQCSMVHQVYVHGDSKKSCLIAVVVPEKDPVQKWADKNAVQGDMDSWCTNEKVNKAILDQMIAEGKKEQLKSFEQVKAISLTPETFSVENGLLTPTLKFKRPALKTHFKQTFEDLYSTIPE